MSAAHEPVRAYEAAIGLGALLAGVLAVVGFCSWLLPEPDAHVALLTSAPPAVVTGGSDCPAAAPRSAAVVTSTRLLECPEAYDGARVRYRGEMVGAVLVRGERAWAQLNDDPYALGPGALPRHRLPLGANSGLAVSLPADVAAGVAHVGSYRAQGDLVEVVGTFRRADPADAGGPAIQAVQATVLVPGQPLVHRAPTRLLLAAAALALVTLGVAGWSLRARRQPPP